MKIRENFTNNNQAMGNGITAVIHSNTTQLLRTPFVIYTQRSTHHGTKQGKSGGGDADSDGKFAVRSTTDNDGEPTK
jgi:hypothetical protein